LNHGDQLVAV